MTKPPGNRGVWRCSPDGIRTRAMALRGRRARPLHNGALQCCEVTQWFFGSGGNHTGKGGYLRIAPHRKTGGTHAGVQGLEPRLTEPESVVLPITPYPKGVSHPGCLSDARTVTRG